MKKHTFVGIISFPKHEISLIPCQKEFAIAVALITLMLSLLHAYFVGYFSTLPAQETMNFA